MASFIKEFAKAFPLFYRHGETERSLLTLGLMVGLGFGVSELFIYVIGSGESIHTRLPGMLFHAASTSITAYGIAIKRPMPFYLIASLLHLMNNILATNSSYWFPAGPIVLMTTYFLSLHLYNKTREKMIS